MKSKTKPQIYLVW